MVDGFEGREDQMSEEENPVGHHTTEGKAPRPEEKLASSRSGSPSCAAPDSPGIKERRQSTPAQWTTKNSESDKQQAFSVFVHSYVWSSILLAEQKAGFLFASNTAFLGYLVSTLPKYFADFPLAQQVLAGAAILSLVLSNAAVLAAVFPRMGGNSTGLIYFKAISERPSSLTYADEVSQSSNADLEKATATHVYEISRICREKYRCVRIALILAFAGFAIGLVWLSILRGSAKPEELFM